MSGTMTDIEIIKAMTTEEQDSLLGMMDDIKKLGPHPTRAQVLMALLPHLNSMFGDVYEDIKPELEATYGEELVAAHRELDEE